MEEDIKEGTIEKMAREQLEVIKKKCNNPAWFKSLMLKKKVQLLDQEVGQPGGILSPIHLPLHTIPFKTVQYHTIPWYAKIPPPHPPGEGRVRGRQQAGCA